jgi:hypothetical protein
MIRHYFRFHYCHYYYWFSLHYYISFDTLILIFIAIIDIITLSFISCHWLLFRLLLIHYRAIDYWYYFIIDIADTLFISLFRWFRYWLLMPLLFSPLRWLLPPHFHYFISAADIIIFAIIDDTPFWHYWYLFHWYYAFIAITLSLLITPHFISLILIRWHITFITPLLIFSLAD